MTKIYYSPELNEFILKIPLGDNLAFIDTEKRAYYSKDTMPEKFFDATWMFIDYI